MPSPNFVTPQTKAAEVSSSRMAPQHRPEIVQSSIGNQAALRSLAQRASPAEQEVVPEDMTAREAPLPGIIQAKMAIGQINDPLEHEADHAADSVMRMPDPSLPMTSAPPRISRKCAVFDEEAQPLQTKGLGSSVAPSHVVAGIAEEVPRMPGQPLGLESRAFFEPRFGYDFSRVRVHADPLSSESAQSIGALAYTVGQDIVFQTGQYAPSTDCGDRLLAHELAHVVQQGGGREGGPSRSSLSAVSDARVQREPGGEPPQLPAVSQTTEDQIKELMDEHPGLTRVNAERALLGPDGATTKLSGTTEKRMAEHKQQTGQTKGPVQTPKVPDIEFRQRTADGNVVLRREVKTWEGNQGKFNNSMSDARDQLLKQGSGGEVLVQVPGGTNALEVMLRFKRPGDLSPEQQGKRLGWYRSIRVIMVDPSGNVLFDEPVEFPPSRIEPSGGSTPPGGTPSGDDPAQVKGLGTTPHVAAPPPGKDATADPGKEPKAEVGDPIAPVAEHGPSAGGTAAMEAGPIALQIIGSVLNHFGDKHQAELANEALKPFLRVISQELASHPDEGVLIVNEYVQAEAGEASVVQPGKRFLQPRIAYGRTQDEARAALGPSYEPSTTGEGMRPVADEVWYQPRHADAAGYASPFPDIAVARFKPGHEQLQRVKWLRGKLSDAGSISLQSALKWGSPSFHVLRLPETIAWTEPGGRHGTTTLSLKNKPTANNFGVPTGDGDVPIMAADELTFQLFQAVSGGRTLDDNGELRFTNIDYMRWARAEDIEIVKILSHEDVTAAIPTIERAEAEKVLANAPAPVRALYQTLTHIGHTTTTEDVIERFIAVVPSDLTMDEVDRLTARLGKAKSAGQFFASLATAIQNLRAHSAGEGMAPGGGIDFRKSTDPGYTPAGLTGQITVLLDGLNWSEVSSGPTYFDKVIGQEGTFETFAYGIDDEGRHWGALVTVSVAKAERGQTPVTVRGSTALVSEQGQAIYGNSLLWGKTFRLSPEQGSVSR